MEHLKSHESVDFVKQNPEAKKEAISKETDRLFGVLESPDIEVDDLNSLLDRLSSNPLFRDELGVFQDYNSSALENVLIANMEVKECVEGDPLDYFGVRSEFTEISRDLEDIGLDLGKLLSDYRGFIETELAGFDEAFVEKVKSSITTRLKEVSSIIEDLKNSEIQRFGSLEKFNENRWIINEKVGEHLSFINNELLSSLQAYSKIKGGANVPERFTNKFDTTNGMTNGNVPQNPNYINVEYKIGEIEELMTASLDSEGNFDEGLFSTQSIFNTEKESHRELLLELGVQEFEVSLLNEKDKEIQDKATLYFMAMIGVQIGVETFGGVVGNIAGGGIDVYDAFSSEEELLNIAQNLGLADKEFRMDKTWVDNVLAGLGLIPGATQAIKGPKLASFMEKVDAKAFENAVSKVKEKVGLGKPFSEDEQVRLSLAENLLGRELDTSEKSAIIEAHNLGEKVEGEYSYSDIKEKYMVLKESGFDEGEIRTLMERGITGKEIVELPGGVYERYPFLKGEEYAELREILGENTTLNDVIGEGQNAIILRNPLDDQTILKVARGDKESVDDLIEEVDNQSRFYKGWKELFKSGDLDGLEHFRIPKVDRIEGTDTVFVMQKIEGQNFKTQFYKEHYREELSDVPNLDSLSDGQVENILLEKGLEILPKDTSNTERVESTDEGWDFLRKFDKYWDSKYWPANGGDIRLFVDKMKSIGLYHDDDHAGNFMLDKDGNIYMIDFGRVVIPSKKTKSSLFQNF